jgi:hypothetical protein
MALEHQPDYAEAQRILNSIRWAAQDAITIYSGFATLLNGILFVLVNLDVKDAYADTFIPGSFQS